jgi:hypothetical protein
MYKFRKIKVRGDDGDNDIFLYTVYWRQAKPDSWSVIGTITQEYPGDKVFRTNQDIWPWPSTVGEEFTSIREAARHIFWSRL